MDVGGILPEELEAHCEHSADGHTLFPCGLHVSRIPTKQGAPRQPVTRGSGGEQYGWETGIEPDSHRTDPSVLGPSHQNTKPRGQPRLTDIDVHNEVPILDDLKELVESGDISRKLARCLPEEIFNYLGCPLQVNTVKNNVNDQPPTSRGESTLQYEGGVDGDIADPD